MITRDTLTQAIETLFASLEKLEQMDGVDFILSGHTSTYHTLLETTYAALSTLETGVNALGEQLEVQRDRLDQAHDLYADPTEDLLETREAEQQAE